MEMWLCDIDELLVAEIETENSEEPENDLERVTDFECVALSCTLPVVDVVPDVLSVRGPVEVCDCVLLELMERDSELEIVPERV